MALSMHVQFKTITPGQFLEYKGEFYMKLEVTAGSGFRKGGVNAVNLYSGSEAVFCEDDYICATKNETFRW